MNTLAFVTHPSVRIKGTENNYTPSLCLDERCPIKAPHMHCPFCVKTDAYQDPVILKAHYRVKHVDKGIEFAGLKILRCCDHCDIVGIIKGEKHFKGAHWHCYRCRNGFNRRDEAIKHYKTHFRNPQTTFQIQITQDLNLPSGVKAANHQHQESINQQNFPSSVENPIQDIIHPVLSQTPLSDPNVMTADGSLANNKFKKVKVKEEPMLSGEEPVTVDQGQTIMIIQGDHLESAFADHIIHSGGEVSVLDKNSMDSNLSWEIRCRMEEEEKNEYKARMEEYKNQVEVLQQRIQDLETQQPSQLRVQDLLASLSLGNNEKHLLAQQISKYLEELQTQEAEADLTNQNTQDLVTSEGIIHQLNPTDQTDCQLASLVRTSLPQELQSGSVVTHLGQITEPYHVISSESNSHSIIINHTDGNNIQNIDNQTKGVVNSDLKKTGPENVPSSAEAREDLYLPATPESHDQEIIVAQVMSSDVQSDTIHQNFLVADSSLPPGEHNVINIEDNTENRLLQVVAASSAHDKHGSNTLIMETESGQRIIIQRSENTESEVVKRHNLEPESKRLRVS